MERRREILEVASLHHQSVALPQVSRPAELLPNDAARSEPHWYH